MAEENLGMIALVNQSKDSPQSAQFLERIPNPQRQTTFRIERLRKPIEKGLKDAGVVQDVDTYDLDEMFNQMVTVFTPKTTPSDKDRIIVVHIDGKREFYQVNDASLYDAITNLGAAQVSGFMRLVSYPVSVLKAGATLTIGFIMRNWARDTVVAAFQSKYGFLPGIDTVIGLVEQIRGGLAADLYYAAGIQQATFAANTRNDLKRNLAAITKSGWKNTVLGNAVVSPIDTLRAISSALETATRLGEFKLALEAGGKERGVWERLTGPKADPSTWDADVLAIANLAAGDVSTDFQRAGITGRQLNRYYAFFNAWVQGYARAGETIRDDPKGTALRASSLALFSLALAAMNADDDEYAELQEWEKHSYWFVKLPGAKSFKIPKPFEYGYIADLVEASYDYARKNDPRRFRTMGEYFKAESMEQAVLRLMPTTVLPLIEMATNYSTFRDTHIVRPWDKDGLPADLQFNEFTSETAKLLGQAMNFSPALIDHLVFGYTGGLGRGAVEAADVILRSVGIVDASNRPTRPTQQIPGIGTVIRDRTIGLSSQSVQDVYDYAEAWATLEAGVKEDAGKGDADRALRRLEAAKDKPWFARREIIRKTRASFLKLGAATKKIYAAPISAMSPAEKRHALDLIAESMFKLAAMALGRTTREQSRGQ